MNQPIRGIIWGLHKRRYLDRYRDGVGAPSEESAEAYHAHNRGMRIEVGVMLAVTFGISALIAILQLTDAVLTGLADYRVRLNPNQSRYDLVNLGLNLTSIAQLTAWGALGLYLLWRSGISPAQIGMGRIRWRIDLGGGLGLAAFIGIPGLLLYFAGRFMGINAAIQPVALADTWWRIPILIAAACAHGFAEEVVVVGYLMTRLRQLGYGRYSTLFASSILRGLYHLYQGFTAGLGNMAMGLVFGYVWNRTGRLWPLVMAHSIIDIVAFVGYALLAGRLGWAG